MTSLARHSHDQECTIQILTLMLLVANFAYTK